MLNEIIQDFNQRMEIRILEISAEFAQQLDFAGLETAIGEECARFSAELQQAILEALLLEEIFLDWLKIYAGRRGMRFKERRTITVTLSNGHRIKVHSPYFVKAKPHIAGVESVGRTVPVLILVWKYWDLLVVPAPLCSPMCCKWRCYALHMTLLVRY